MERKLQQPSSSSSSPSPWERPSFFKVMIGPDFCNTVRIPPYFKRYFGEQLPEKALLRRPGSRQWEVAIGLEDGHFYFQDGWNVFAMDNTVSWGEFIIFFHVGGFVFDVLIYGTSACARPLQC